jgi:hypothetical protein
MNLSSSSSCGSRLTVMVRLWQQMTKQQRQQVTTAAKQSCCEHGLAASLLQQQLQVEQATAPLLKP